MSITPTEESPTATHIFGMPVKMKMVKKHFSNSWSKVRQDKRSRWPAESESKAGSHGDDAGGPGHWGGPIATCQLQEIWISIGRIPRNMIMTSKEESVKWLEPGISFFDTQHWTCLKMIIISANFKQTLILKVFENQKRQGKYCYYRFDLG